MPAPSSIWWKARGGRAHIPTSRDRKVQRSVDHCLYRQRNLVERFFNRLKHFRRVATRYDKTARNFLAAVLLAATRLWARFEFMPREPFGGGGGGGGGGERAGVVQW